MSLQSKLKRNLESIKQNISDINSEQNGEVNSKFFRNNESDRNVFYKNLKSSIPEQFLTIIFKMNTMLKELNFSSPVDYVYNPTEYAFNNYSTYIHKYCSSPKEIMFLGMNPGPWGMSQTGVPFGEISITRDWLQISGPVNKPPRELSIRPIDGFDCTRTEVSGKRFWGLFKELCGTADNFFQYAFTHNYCPLAFMKSDGKNVTPADIKGPVSKHLIQICDQALCEVLTLMHVKIVVGVGRYTEKRAKTVIDDQSMQGIQVLFLTHPSPRVVGSERWHENTIKHLQDLDLLKYFQKAI